MARLLTSLSSRWGSPSSAGGIGTWLWGLYRPLAEDDRRIVPFLSRVCDRSIWDLVLPPSLRWITPLKCGGSNCRIFAEMLWVKRLPLWETLLAALVALQAAVSTPEWCESVVLINCSLRLLHDSKRQNLSLPQRFGTPVLQRILQVKPIGQFFFNQIARRRSLKNILKQAYRRHETITDELLDILLTPASDLGAADVFISFISYSSGPLAETLLPQMQSPVAIVWGGERSVGTAGNGAGSRGL